MLVLEQDRKDAVLQAMGSETMRKILLSTMYEAKSIERISIDTGLPLSTCYRRVHELVGSRLLRVERIIITSAGKKYEIFRSQIKDAILNFSAGEISVEVTFVPREPEQKLPTIWNTTRGEETQLVSTVQ